VRNGENHQNNTFLRVIAGLGLIIVGLGEVRSVFSPLFLSRTVINPA